MIRHMVFLKVKVDTLESTIIDAFSTLGDFFKTLPGTESFSWGHSVSVEGLNRDYTHSLSMDFLTMEDLKYYIEHPTHVAIATDKLLPMTPDGIDSVLAFDYEY